MRRKIACYVTAFVTVLFMILRVITAVKPEFLSGIVSAEDAMIGIALVSMLIITLLCFSKSNELVPVEKAPQPILGWLTTFCGALLIMSVVLDVFCWLVFRQIPPPNDKILNQIDLYTLILSLIFGACGGFFLLLQGFNWMAQISRNRTVLSWLSLAPVLWMWFRLARYEISYASTIDISESFFDFASLVTASLFLLQLARVTTGVGAQPKNALLIFSLFTTISSLSGAPLTVYQLIHGKPVSVLLIALVDATIGLLAFIIAIGQAFTKQEIPSREPKDDMAWTEPAKERQPLDPPFSIDDLLPDLDSDTSETPTEASSDSQTTESDKALTVDDILAELNKDI